MDPNHTTEPQSQRDDSQYRGRQSRSPSSYSSMAAGTSAVPAGHSEEFIPVLEPGTIHTDVAHSPVPASARRETQLEPDLHLEYDLEAGLASPRSPTSTPAPKVVTVNKLNTTAASLSPEVTPLPPAIVASRRNTAFTDNNASKATSLMRESRRIPSGPEQSLDRKSSTMQPAGTGSELDWIVPVEKKSWLIEKKTVAERLDPTLKNAKAERDKYARKAQLTGYSLNAAIGLQVLLGSLTTALSVVVKGSQIAVMTATLGGFSTIVASFLARARGSNEPELSITRVKDLDQFIRECDAFMLDRGHDTGDKYDDELNRLRGRFEELLGNANGERKLSPT